MKEQKLVSVIIPAYNAANFITETINSVLQQTYSHLELIIVNDGSTDNTLQILNDFKKSDAKIKVINKSNSGVCDSRNTGLKEAKGDFTIFLDADDVWDLTFLESCTTIFENDKNVQAIYTKGQFINEKSEKLDKFITANTIYSASDILEWKKGFVATPSCTIFRTPVNNNTEIWDVNLSTAADQDYFIRAAAKHPIQAIDKVLFFYRIHDNNMHQNIKVMEQDHTNVYKKAEKLGLFKSFWFKRKCFSKLYLTLAGSWWRDGNNKLKGIYFILKSLISYPPMVLKIMSKLIK